MSKRKELIIKLVRDYLINWILPNREGLGRQYENVGLLSLILAKNGIKTRIVIGTNTASSEDRKIISNDGKFQEIKTTQSEYTFEKLVWLEYKKSVIAINPFYHEDGQLYIINPIILGVEQPLPEKITKGSIVMENKKKYERNKRLSSKKAMAHEVPFLRSNKILRLRLKNMYSGKIVSNKMISKYF